MGDAKRDVSLHFCASCAFRYAAPIAPADDERRLPSPEYPPHITLRSPHDEMERRPLVGNGWLYENA